MCGQATFENGSMNKDHFETKTKFIYPNLYRYGLRCNVFQSYSNGMYVDWIWCTLMILHQSLMCEYMCNCWCEHFSITFAIPMRGFTSPQVVVIHWRRSFLGQRLSTHVSWALGFRCNLHMLSGTTTALAPGSVLLQKTLRFFNPRPQVLEH